MTIKSKWVVWLSLGLFVLSLPFDSYCASGCGNSLLTLVIGIFAVFTVNSECISGLCWLANPLLLAAWIFAKHSTKMSLVMSFGAAFLTILFYCIGTVYADEGGHYKEVEAYKAGYWLWVASALVMLLGNLLIFFNNRKAIAGTA